MVVNDRETSSGSARRTQCLNNSRQIGIGLIEYVNKFKTFPNAVTYDERTDAESVDATDPTTFELESDGPGVLRLIRRLASLGHGDPAAD